MDDRSLGTLSLFSSEILVYIMGFVGEDLESTIECTAVSRSFQSLVWRVRVPTGKILRSQVLTRVPTLRSISGPVLAIDFRELTTLRTACVYFPDISRDIRLENKGEKLAFYLRSLRKIRGDYGELFNEVVVRSLEFAQRQILQHPYSRILLRMAGDLRIKWRAGRLRLHLPIWTGTWLYDDPGEVPVSQNIVAAIREFLRVVPVTHLSFIPYVFQRSNKLECVSSPTLFNELLESPCIQTLTSLTVNIHGDDELASYLTTVDPSRLPVIRTLRSQVPKRGSSCSPWSNTPNLYSILRDFRKIPTFASNITSIEGPGYLSFDRFDLKQPAKLVRLFSNVRSWNVLVDPEAHDLDLSKVREVGPYDLTEESLDETLSHIIRRTSSPETPLSQRIISCFRDFWLQYRHQCSFSLWCLGWEPL